MIPKKINKYKKEVFKVNSELIAQGCDWKDIFNFWKELNEEIKQSNIEYLYDKGLTEVQIHNTTGLYYSLIQKVVSAYVKANGKSQLHRDSTQDKFRLNGSVPFWEVPCNPITGYSLTRYVKADD